MRPALLCGALLASLALAACSAAAPAPSATSSPSRVPASPTATPQPSPTASPQPPTADPALLSWPSYPAPTLAPFPLAPDAAATSTPPAAGYPARQAPLALSLYDHFYFTFPVASAHLGLYSPSQRYGVRQEAGQSGEPHLGLDVGMDAGTPVRAAAGGTVVWADYGQTYNSRFFLDDPYGISIVIRHDFGFAGNRIWTVYAHLSETSVQVGQRVEQGEVIALSGNTGLSTGPHLHFEVRSGQNNTSHTSNPELWLAPPQGYGILAGRVGTQRNQVLVNKLVEVRAVGSEQLWTLYTYIANSRILPDPYYKENLVLSNLPAGRYEISIPYQSTWWRAEVEVIPGTVTYFQFRGTDGYSFELPAAAPLVGVPD
ncbi:MAG: M23 family metallopeptidase [Anaerolineales bacterium]|nr:M23 family metallopeptidase [Anaerolineales bacterium]